MLLRSQSPKAHCSVNRPQRSVYHLAEHPENNFFLGRSGLILFLLRPCVAYIQVFELLVYVAVGALMKPIGTPFSGHLRNASESKATP